MKSSALRFVVLLGAAACPWACADNDGLVLPGTMEDSGSPPATSDADASLPPASDASSDASDEDAKPAAPKCSDGGFCLTELPTSEVLYAVWGASDGSLWAGGSRSILHWDGTAWKTAFTWPDTGAPGVRAKIIVGTGPEDVWAFGDAPESGASSAPAVAHLARRDSVLAWRAVTSDLQIQAGSSGTAWAAGPSDLWLAWGYEGLWHVRGEDDAGHVVAERERGGSGQPLLAFPYGVWGFGSDRVFASGYDPTDTPVLLRRTLDGGWVNAVDASTVGHTPWRIHGTGPNDARLWSYDGWTTRMRAVTADGTLLAPELQRNGDDLPACRPTLASAVRSDLAWVSDGTTVCRYDGSSFEMIPISIGGYPRFTVHALWSNGTDTWIVGEEKPRAIGGPPRGFALHRKGGS